MELFPFNNKAESSRDLTILIISSISSFDIIRVLLPDPKIILCISAHETDDAAVNPNVIKTLLANSLITFFIDRILVFNNWPGNLPRSPPDYIILGNWAFENFISFDKSFAKVFCRFKTCILVNNNLWQKVVSSSELPIIFEDNIKTTSVLFSNCRLLVINLWIW